MLVQMKIGMQVNGKASPIRRREWEQIKDRKNKAREHQNPESGLVIRREYLWIFDDGDFCF